MALTEKGAGGRQPRHVPNLGIQLSPNRFRTSLSPSFIHFFTFPGEAEARRGGQELRKEKFEFDVVLTSVLKRAICTAHLAMDELDQLWVPFTKDWRLNERHYGALTGLNKAETAEKMGEEQVKLWRRSYDIPPPPMEETHEYAMQNDRRYAHLASSEIPRTEALDSTVARVLPWWEGVAEPLLRSGQRPIVVAHGNSLRALVKHLDGISNEDIIGINIPTGVPLVYELDDDLKPIEKAPPGKLSGKYLGDPEQIAREAAEVAKQASKK